ncbi:MAG: arsenical pump-driving ATPase [Fuerstiella sp.]
MQLLSGLTRSVFFTGKGGVGKTTMACAISIQLADSGKKVLLVSTDPASNLDEVLQTSLSSKPTAVSNVANLWALNIDPEAAAADYRERMVGPYRGVLPDVAIASMEEQYSGSCTVEIAAFDEFAKLLGDTAATQEFDHVIFDTAPTGHTLRLLALPSAWSGYIESNTSGTSCLGPLAGLQKQQDLYQKTVSALSDQAVTTLALVTRPEPAALQEAERSSNELRKLGIQNQHLIINGIFQCEDPDDALAVAMQLRCDEALAEVPHQISQLPMTKVLLDSTGVVGVESLRQIGNPSKTLARDSDIAAAGDSVSQQAAVPGKEQTANDFQKLIEDLAASGHGVIMTMGKGGVGKTTIAAAVAVALAESGHQVHLSTTDPAAHVSQVTQGITGSSRMTVSRVDPEEVTEAYRQEVLANAGKDLDDNGRSLLDEDLRSPCTEEIAVFRAFAEEIAKGKDQFVVLDTAPTGHTILLLDAALAYHHEVSRQTHDIPENVRDLLPRLRDPEFTKVLIVTLPAATPVHEAAKLQTDLQRAEIFPFSWIVNHCLTPHTVTDTTLQQRRLSEQPFLKEVQQLSSRMTLIPWQPSPPVGPERLSKIASPCS